MTLPLILTGIDLPMEPSCGSTIWCSDVYPRLDGFRTVFAGLPGSGTWKHSFTDTILLGATKQPYGPAFDTYTARLTEEVADLLEEHHPDLIHAQHLGFGLSLAFARTAGTRRQRIPIVSVAHGTDVIAAAENDQALSTLREIAAASERLVVPTPAMASEVDRLTDGRHTSRLSVVPWGIPLPEAPFTQPGGGRRLSLVHAGRLDANKFTRTAIEALALTEEPHQLTVIGSGSELAALQDQAANLDLGDRARFEAFLPRDELWSRLPDFDLMLFTTRQLEAYGLVAVEAQAHGVPVLYSDLPGLKDILGPGALSYPPGDAAALAVLIDDLAADPTRRQTLRADAIANARRHDVAGTAEGLAALSRSVLEGLR
ncbi:glycosyltransferase family 4 protein [Streptomyces sp. UH6]|uniref:glycosyltransferase family 4 protein n=1 Tax=Streptomyces sp. UH6 TaxID=2748379 RepID=UPI0015D4E021|nr:glycosyltransferase family 4 protein [Streptomyces sp. UH6]NYV72803.1 glycosyltransferase family 4 protein [Streptomyces sp. UH6]